MKHIKNYLQNIKKVKDQLEHSGRTYLENFLNNFCEAKKVKIIHEPKRDKEGRGSPDFQFLFNDTTIGFLENKKVGESLDHILKSKQIEKYKTLTDNLILTDYLRWIWIYKDKIIKDVRLCEITTLEQKNISIEETTSKKLIELIEDFLSQKPQTITKANDLAKILAKPTRTIKEEIERQINEDIKESQNSELKGLFSVFQEKLIKNMTPDEFADAFAQTLTYSLFLTKLNLKKPNDKLDLNNISVHIPQSFALIKDILRFIQVLDKYPNLKPYIERILHIINHVNAFELLSDLKFTRDEEKDPYIYFYEDFLKAYNPKIRVDAGVYYTPEPVVRSIVINIHEILKNDFNLESGLANNCVKVLDFACGTATFLLQVYYQILAETLPNSLKRKNLIKNHILKNIFGFELLIPAYCISHLKLSQYLKENKNYYLEKDERIGVYLTNTLESREKFSQNTLFDLLPEIANEGKKAQAIKEDRDILVITGNPPYNYKSNNHFKYIQDLIKPYFPDDDIKERNPKGLQDDYVKFIRFAENKIATSGKGVVGIITNHSFIDNPTFRQMRKHLMDSFDKIYIIDLHGNAKKKEKCPDGSPDKNVFDIQQGVAISFFVKNPAIKDKGIYHLDIFGTRKTKFEQIAKINLQKNTRFTKLNPSQPFYLFIPQNEELRKEYEKGWSLRKVFSEMNVGIVTGKDTKVIDIDEKKLQKKIKENFDNFDNKFVQNISYRPFDNRKIYYDTKTKGVIGRARNDIMSHLLNHDNVGLVFTRQVATNFFNHCFISDKIMESCFISSTTKEINTIAPLYKYQKALSQEEKTPNFDPDFLEVIEEKFGEVFPEEILGYIYAVLHAPSYRKKYLEFLKIDFPKIPFDVSSEKFKKLSALGSELIEVHLMKKIPLSKIGEPEAVDGKENYVMEKVRYDEPKQRIYFNQTCYFANVSQEIQQFKIGGYQVLDKYLKARKGMDISENLEHVQKVIKILDFTVEQMKKIDEIKLNEDNNFVR